MVLVVLVGMQILRKRVVVVVVVMVVVRFLGRWVVVMVEVRVLRRRRMPRR